MGIFDTAVLCCQSSHYGGNLPLSRRAVDQAVNFSLSDMNSCLSKDWPSPFLTNRVRLFLTASANLRCSLCFCRAFLASGVSPVDSPGQPGPRFSP